VKVVLGVSGGIAAYKAPDLVRRLQDAGAAVRVILTPNAARFVSPLSLATVSNHPVIVAQWGDTSTGQWGDSSHGGVDHIELARWADVLLIAPATANVIAKVAVGIGDDALTTYALAHRGDVVIAPAMNSFMLAHPTVIQNLNILRARGVDVIEPDWGLLACGDEGAGRMPDAPVLIERVRSHFVSKDLDGKSVLVTAGPTREAIDPVRYISNRSSGKMGYALAEAARRRGATVTLVSGPVSIAAPSGIAFSRVTTAREMHDAVLGALPQQIVIKAAAVADFAPQQVADRKIKKERGRDEMTLALQKTPDILEALAKVKPHPFVVAFAAETNDVIDNAKKKLQSKSADLIVANDVSDQSIGFDSDQNEVLVIARDGANVKIARASKLVVANRILDEVVKRL
jgi:phosphopantothenoylcysteine decarboxylase/phosphopantothenate--cysteine ligase